jgi:AraC family transcriptional regulator
MEPNDIVPDAGDIGGAGQLVSTTLADARHARVELLLSSGGPVSWRFRPSVASLLWVRSGLREGCLDVHGRGARAHVSATKSLFFYPAQARFDGEFVVDPVCDYSVVFLDPESTTAPGIRLPVEPMLGFAHEPLVRGLRDLREEAEREDGLFDLYAEGWATLAMAHLVRLAGRAPDGRSDRGSGLPVASLRRVEEHVRSRLAERLTVDELADAAGFSRRHFTRAFRRSVGLSPLSFVRDMRIEEAKRRLETGGWSIASIAVELGFGHPQHFSTAFRLATGLAPSEYRRHFR